MPVQGLDAYYHQIRSMISEELDFLREAQNITRIAENFVEAADACASRAPVDGLSHAARDDDDASSRA